MRAVPFAYLRWLVPLAWTGLIFGGSTDVLSAQHTSRFVEPFLRWLFHGTLSVQGIDEIHFLIRKTGHLCEYAVLCLLFWWALPSRERAPRAAPRPWRREIFALVLAAAFAASDEYHQSFVLSRGASVEDVLIDTAGAAGGLAAMLGISRAARTLRRRREPARRSQAGTAADPSLPG